ncbi:MAG TPA: hypothetical protein VN369_02220 [Terriglobales bacterium]|nr:hypothetical protein [Terriglobales bacterium]
MNSKGLYEAVGGIDESYIEDADVTKSNRQVRVMTFAPRLKRAMPIAACLAVMTGVFLGYNALRPLNPFTGDEPGNPGYITGDSTIGKPSLKIEEEANSAACYAEPDDWRGLAAENFVLQEQTESHNEANRIVFQTLQDLADYADAFIIVPNVHKIAPDGDNIQTAIAEYAGTIGDRIRTRQWDDYTISTGNRILIRQTLIGGCTMDDPNNLLRAGGVYLLPVKFNSSLGAYEVAGDFDVLFELDAEGKIVSHSRFPELNKYDGKVFSDLLNAVRALYPMPETEFNEQPIDSREQAERQINTAYINSGFRKFTAVFEKESVIKGADVYLFKVTFGEDGSTGSEYGAIAKTNGAFIRGAIDANGEFQIYGGLGGFPKNS